MEKNKEGATRPARALTHRFLESLQPEAGAYRIPDSRCQGLAARMAPSGVISWDMAYRIARGGTRRPSLGKWPDISIEAARDRGNDLRRAARAGRDLLKEEEDAKVEEARQLTVEQLIQLYMKRRARHLRTAKEIERRLRRALGSLLERRARDIRRADVRDLLDVVDESGLSREAEKRRQVIGAMFRWAIAKDYVEIDPAAGLPSYDPGTPRDRVLSIEEIRELLDWLDADVMPPDHTDVLRVQLLTGARCGEVAGMAGEEVDPDGWIWTLPAVRSKNKKPRVTPLVGIAREIVKRRHKAGYLFLSERGTPLTSGIVGQVLIKRRKDCPLEHFTTHDLRRTFVSQLAAMGISVDLIASMIGHEGGSRETRTLLRHYVRGDFIERKRIALESWDSQVNQIRTEMRTSKIVRIGDRHGA
jgi:integrase